MTFTTSRIGEPKENACLLSCSFGQDFFVEVTVTHIQKSDNYPKIKDRVFYLSKLEELLDSDETVFKYNRNEAIFSRINAEFLLKNANFERTIFTFIKLEDDGKYVCNSFFPESDYDYSKNQISWKVISKKKIDLETGEIALIAKK